MTNFDTKKITTFFNKNKNLIALFESNVPLSSIYQLEGDNKIQKKFTKNLLNTLSSKSIKPKNNQKNLYFSHRSYIPYKPTHSPLKSFQSMHLTEIEKKPKRNNRPKYNTETENLIITEQNSDFTDYNYNENNEHNVSYYKKATYNLPQINEDSLKEEFLINLYNLIVYDPSNITPIELTEKQKKKFGNSNPYIYTFNCRKMHPFCFFHGTKYPQLIKKNGEMKLPEGKIVNSTEWAKEPDYSLKGIYKGIKIDDKLGLVIVDPTVKKKYSGLVANIIFQLLKIPFGHHMSLQVKMFEPKCLQERASNIFSFANKYLIKASNKLISTYERFKIIITFIFSGLYIPAQQLKPFNPFIGETFEGELPNGAKFYVEQACHKPLCARYYMFYENIYKVYGYFNFDVRSEGLGSVMYVCDQGPMFVEFPQINEKLVGHIPEIKIVNARSEEGRANLYHGNLSVIDAKNNLRAIIQFDKNKKIFHEVKGCIYKFNYPSNYKYDYKKEWEFGNKFKMDEIYGKDEFLETVEGSWINKLIIGNKLYWDIKDQIPEFIKPVKNCLPSDGRYREDLLWLYRSFYCAKNEEERLMYENMSQKWKIMMEEFNRWERKRRKDYNELMGY